MNIEEALKKVSYVIPQEKEQDFLTVVDLSDAIMITKDLYTKEQVEELLKKQRENCAEARTNDKMCMPFTIKQQCAILSAPSSLGKKP